MASRSNVRLDALITIVDSSLEDIVTDVFKSSDFPMLLLTHGRGSAKSDLYVILGCGGPK